MFMRRFEQIRTDVPALIDEWAARFFEELDYVNEGRNQTLFAESIREDLPQVRAQQPSLASCHAPATAVADLTPTA